MRVSKHARTPFETRCYASLLRVTGCVPVMLRSARSARLEARTHALRDAMLRIAPQGDRLRIAPQGDRLRPRHAEERTSDGDTL